MTLRLLLAPEAERDLEDAAAWYELQRPGVGAAFLRAVDACFARIQRFPDAYAAGSDR
jgi:plasmid stabilization system protein ParE